MTRGIHDGDLRVTQDGEVSGIVHGKLAIATGCRVVVSGIVNGDLVVERGGAAEVTGIVSGAVRNDGGDVRVSGMVGGG